MPKTYKIWVEGYNSFYYKVNLSKYIEGRVYTNSISGEFSCHLWVRQGECLSPFLFLMFVNDIED